jgi:hypothetical protein
MLVSTSGRNRNPNVIAAVSRRRRRWILRDVEIAILIEREVIWQFEIRSRIHSDFHVIVNEGRGVTLSTRWFSQIYSEYAVFTRYRNVKSICTASIVAG